MRVILVPEHESRIICYFYRLNYKTKCFQPSYNSLKVQIFMTYPSFPAFFGW